MARSDSPATTLVTTTTPCSTARTMDDIVVKTMTVAKRRIRRYGGSPETDGEGGEAFGAIRADLSRRSTRPSPQWRIAGIRACGRRVGCGVPLRLLIAAAALLSSRVARRISLGAQGTGRLDRVAEVLVSANALCRHASKRRHSVVEVVVDQHLALLRVNAM